jgi:hypothetical protein
MHDGLAASLGPEAADSITSGGGQVNPETLGTVPDAVRDPLFAAISSALAEVFIWAIPFAAVVAILAVFIKEVPLRGGPEATRSRRRLSRRGPSPLPVLRATRSPRVAPSLAPPSLAPPGLARRSVFRVAVLRATWSFSPPGRSRHRSFASPASLRPAHAPTETQDHRNCLAIVVSRGG